MYASFWDATKQPRTYDVLRKDCNSDTKDVYIPHFSFVFYRQQLWLLAYWKSRLKFVTCFVFYLLMRNLYIYILYVKNGIQKEFPNVFSKKRRSAAGMLHIYRRIPIQKCDFSRAELTLLHGCSPVNRLNVEHLSRKTPLGDWFCINGSGYNRYQPALTCSDLT